MILLSREQRYLQHAMKAQDYRNPCSPDSDVYICLHIVKRVFRSFSKFLPNLKIAHVIGRAARDQRGDIRDVISRKLVRKNDSPEEVEQILMTVAENHKIS